MIESKSDPKISVKQISIDKEGDDSQTAALANYIGKEPLLWYNGILIPSNYINSFLLDSTGFLPILKVSFIDQTSEMINFAYALDNTIISLYLDSRSSSDNETQVLRPIRIDFKITDYNYIEEEKLFYIIGVIDVDQLYVKRSESFGKLSSYDTLQNLSTSLKLGFSSNIDSTNDVMSWFNPGYRSIDFIEETTKKAYKSDTSFIHSFIDLYYSLNFIDIEKEFSEDIKDGVKGVVNNSETGLEESSQKVDDIILVNKGVGDSGQNNIFESYTVLNKSTKKSIKNGYRSELYYYDKTGNWEEKAGTFLKFVVETNTDGQGIILKSTPSDTENDGFYQTNSNKVYMSAIDIDNTHTQYNYAKLINEINIEEISKISIVATMKKPNFNFYRYQKVKVIIYDAVLGRQEGDNVNQRLSGGWLITGIRYKYANDFNDVKQELIMVKRELSVGNFDF